MELVRIKPPKYAYAYLSAATVAHWAWADGWARWKYPWLGLAAGSAGLFLMFSAASLFKKKNTAIVPTEESSALVLEGPYRWTRNPMYLGILLILMGIALAVGTPPFYAVPVVFFLTIRFVFIPFEEAKLERKFGQAYLDFKRRVRRWM